MADCCYEVNCFGLYGGPFVAVAVSKSLWMHFLLQCGMLELKTIWRELKKRSHEEQCLRLGVSRKMPAVQALVSPRRSGCWAGKQVSVIVIQQPSKFDERLLDVSAKGKL